MLSSLLYTSILVSPGWTYSYTASSGSGPGPYPNTSFFETENRDPDASRSLSFSPFPTGGNDWSWTINITVPRIYDEEPVLSNALILNTVYGIAWPGNATLDETLQGEPSRIGLTDQLCVTVVESLFPTNVTNAYDDSEPGNCGPPLGDSCVQAIIGGFDSANVSTDGCKYGSMSPADLPECHGSFSGYTASVLRKSSATIGGDAISWRALLTLPALISNDTSASTENGSGFFYMATGAFDGLNRTYPDQAYLRMHMIIVEGSQIVPLCARVNTTEKASTDNHAATKKNSAPSVSSVSLWSAGIVTVAALSLYL